MTYSNPLIAERELRKVMFWLFILFGFALLLMVPELANAEGSSTGGLWDQGADEVQKNSDTSFRAWWGVASTWMLWIALGWLAFSVSFLKGAYWWIALLIVFVAAWGEKFVEWGRALKGM